MILLRGIGQTKEEAGHDTHIIITSTVRRQGGRRRRSKRERAAEKAHEALMAAKIAEADEALEVAKRQCSPIRLPQSKPTGMPRNSEGNNVAAAKISVRRDKPSAKQQLKIRAQVLEAARSLGFSKWQGRGRHQHIHQISGNRRQIGGPHCEDAEEDLFREGSPEVAHILGGQAESDAK